VHFTELAAGHFHQMHPSLRGRPRKCAAKVPSLTLPIISAMKLISPLYAKCSAPVNFSPNGL